MFLTLKKNFNSGVLWEMIFTLANSGKRLLLWGTLGKRFLLWGTLGKRFLLWGTLGNYIIFGALYGSLGNDFNSKNFKPKKILLMKVRCKLRFFLSFLV